MNGKDSYTDLTQIKCMDMWIYDRSCEMTIYRKIPGKVEKQGSVDI